MRASPRQGTRATQPSQTSTEMRPCFLEAHADLRFQGPSRVGSRSTDHHRDDNRPVAPATEAGQHRPPFEHPRSRGAGQRTGTVSGHLLFRHPPGWLRRLAVYVRALLHLPGTARSRPPKDRRIACHRTSSPLGATPPGPLTYVDQKQDGRGRSRSMRRSHLRARPRNARHRQGLLGGLSRPPFQSHARTDLPWVDRCSESTNDPFHSGRGRFHISPPWTFRRAWLSDGNEIRPPSGANYPDLPRSARFCR